jgi:hypothetical protein
MYELLKPKHLRRRKFHPGPKQTSCDQLDWLGQDICELPAFEDIHEFCDPWPRRCSIEIAVVCRMMNLLKSALWGCWNFSAFIFFITDLVFACFHLVTVFVAVSTENSVDRWSAAGFSRLFTGVISLKKRSCARESHVGSSENWE